MLVQEQTTINTVASQSFLTLQQSDIILLLKYGGGSAAIILSISILLLAVAEIIKVLVPVMLQGSKHNFEERDNDN